MDTEIIRRLPSNMHKYEKALPKLSYINQTENTWQACKICRGTRTIIIRSRVLNTLTYKKCLNCDGTGIRFNEL